MNHEHGKEYGSGYADVSARQKSSESLFVHLYMSLFQFCVRFMVIPGYTEQTLAVSIHVLS